MILSEVREYVRRRGQASLKDIALHFDSDPEALRSILDHWVRKGRIARRTASSSCGGGCTQCDPATVEIYVWSEAPAVPGEVPLARNLGCKR